jgi:uncharacterized protein (DUF4415 family)
MGRKSSGSSQRVARAKKSAKSTHDRKIDFSDIPELSDEQLAVMKPLGRPLLGSGPRKLIAVRIDPTVLEQLRKEARKAGKGYQTLINDILAKYLNKRAA